VFATCELQHIPEKHKKVMKTTKNVISPVKLEFLIKVSAREAK